MSGVSRSHGRPHRVVFTFVALWHDVEAKLLVWGWILALFLAPEMLAQLYFASRGKHWTQKWYWPHMVALGGGLNIMVLMIANLIGFGAGLKGVRSSDDLMSHISREALFTLATTYWSFYQGVLIMLAIRKYREGSGPWYVDVPWFGELWAAGLVGCWLLAPST